MSRFPFDAVLFDCDGVLVDSEPLVARVLSEMLTARGWPLTPAQAGEVFLGQSVAHLAGLIAERTGKPFTEEWLEEFRQQRNRALEQDLEAIRGGRPRPCVRSPRRPVAALPAPPEQTCTR
nr:HAD family hydrolase [Stenotrophomonas maltophilia]